MSKETEYIEKQTDDLMFDVNRITKNRLTEDETTYIKAYISLKLNVVKIDGRLEGMAEAREIFV